MQFAPHLCFDGSCTEAFQFYRSLIGRELETLLTYGDSPMASDVPEVDDLGSCQLDHDNELTELPPEITQLTNVDACDQFIHRRPT